MPYPNYSLQEVRVIAHNAGFRGDDEVTATAVAWAESKGVATAISPPNKNGTKDYGLWQINSSHFGKISVDNGIFGAFKGYVNEGNVLDPTINSTAAFKLYTGRGNGFGDWSTYNDGTYKQYVTQVTSSTETVQLSGNIATDIKNEVTKSAVTPVLTWLGNTLSVVGFSLLALVLLVAGIAILVSQSKAAKTVGKAVGKVAAVVP